MRLKKKMVKKSFGMAVAAVLLVGVSSAFAGSVLDVDSLRTTTGSRLKQNIRLDTPAVLTMTGMAQAVAQGGASSSSVKLDITRTDGADRTELCGIDRMAVQDVGGFSLLTSASSVRLLSPGVYILEASHDARSASRRSLSMDYVLTKYP